MDLDVEWDGRVAALEEFIKDFVEDAGELRMPRDDDEASAMLAHLAHLRAKLAVIDAAVRS